MKFETILTDLFPTYYEKGIGEIIRNMLQICVRCDDILQTDKPFVSNFGDHLCKECFKGCYECQTEYKEYQCEYCATDTCGCHSVAGDGGRLTILCEQCEDDSYIETEEEDEDNFCNTCYRADCHCDMNTEQVLGDYDLSLYK